MEAVKTHTINIFPTDQPRIQEVDFENLPFGKYFSDHMFVADYDQGEWKNIAVQAYSRLSLAPSTSALHYGQSIFEGMKAYRSPDGKALLFRPEENWKRLNHSARRMCMPEIPEEIFMEGLRTLVRMDQDWIPTKEGSSLYIRPFLFATDEYTGIRISDQYKFVIYSCPVGSYYNKPVRLMATGKYVRAFPGGTGEAKAAGNYAGALLATREAKERGFDNVLWLDGVHHRLIEEVGTMNVFFIIDGVAVTPALDGTTLRGTTRAAVIRLLQDMGIEVQERSLSIDELFQAHARGSLQEIFGTGTAATIAPVEYIGHDGSVPSIKDMEDIALPTVSNWTLAPRIRERITNIRTGKEADPYGWVETL